MKRILVAIIFLSLGAQAAQEGKKTKASKTKTSIKKVEAKSPWSARVSAEHYMGFRTDIVPESAMMASLGYKLNQKHSLLLIQPATKLYEVAKGESEVVAQDTLFYHYYTLSEKLWGGKWRWRTGFTLPVSENSSRQGMMTKLSGTLYYDRMFFGDKLYTSLRPYGRYHLNQFTSTISGRSMRQWSLGMTAISSYSWTKKFSTALSAGIANHGDERHPEATQAPNPTGGYILETSMSYQVLKKLSVTLAYSQADSYTKEGYYEANLFDELATRYYIATEYSF